MAKFWSKWSKSRQNNKKTKYVLNLNLGLKHRQDHVLTTIKRLREGFQYADYECEVQILHPKT